MKVFMCKVTGSYAGGLAVVAANSAEEAYRVFHKHPDKKWMLDMTNNDPNDIEVYTDDPDKCDSIYYPRDKWYECPYLTANVNTPQLIDEDSHIE